MAPYKPTPADLDRQQEWGLAPLRSVALFGFGVALFDLVNRRSGRAHRLAFYLGSKGPDLKIRGRKLGLPVSVSLTSDDYDYFTTPKPMNFEDFDGLAAAQMGGSAGVYAVSTMIIFGRNPPLPIAHLSWASTGLSTPEVPSPGSGVFSLIWGRGIPAETPELIPGNLNPPDLVRDGHYTENRTDGSIVIRVRGDMLFDFDKSEVKYDARGALTDIVTFAAEYPQHKYVSIEGHTDDVGSAGYNQKLSERRADAIYQWISSNLSPAAFKAQSYKSTGFGERKPRVPNRTERSRKINRRVEIVLWRVQPKDWNTKAYRNPPG